MAEFTTRVWEITAPGSIVELHLDDQSSLDTISGQLPDGFYTTFRTYAQGTRVVGLAGHLARLYSPAGGQQQHPACTVVELRRTLDRAMQEYRPQEIRMRVSIDNETGHLFFSIQPLSLPPPEVYIHGVQVVTTTAQRQKPALKSTTFISESQAERSNVKGTSAYEGLIVRNCRILEGLTSNFFYIWEGELGTAGRDVLPGITRQEVLYIAREILSIPIRYRALQLEQVPFIQEAFICSSSREIVPVVQLDNVQIGSGEVGPLTRRLMQAYKQSVLERAERFV
jgi:branched-chain amino acid aminotransferase